jgi:cysteine synthase B
MVGTHPKQQTVRPIDLIGNTPLVELTKIAADLAPGVRLLAKAEMANPGGSVKDRPALAMIRDGIERGLLTPEKTILEATSGNTGIALAMIGTALGYRVELCLPENASPERKRILKAYGAEVVLTSAMESSDGAIREARRRYAETPDRYFYADQYSNPANWQAHYATTAPEIWEQTAGTVTHFVAGVGTSGTFIGTARRLREFDPGIRLIAMHPDGPYHGLEGMKHMESALVPAIYDPSVADENVTVATEDAYAMVKRLARDEGLLVGISAGANVHAALQIARHLQQGTVVTILCDGADKYLSARFWDEE